MTGRTMGRIGMLALALAAAGLGLGGCNDQKYKDEIATIKSENETLRLQNQAQAEQLKTKEAQLTTLGPGGGIDGGDLPQKKTRPVADRPVRETRIEVAGDKLFGPGSVTIMAAGKAELDKVATRIKNEFPGASLRVEGYTDTDPPNKVKAKYPTNEALSQARAKEVEKYLSSRGISSNRIEVVGMGAANPKATKAASRRVEIVVVGS